MHTLIIGAGPAGLAVAGRLRKKNIPFEIIEKTEKIAWSWHNHYDRLCLHTVKQLSHLPHLKFPEHYPLYVPREDLARYYEDYADHFDIRPHFGLTARAVSRTDTGEWLVKTQMGKSFQVQHLVVATGVNRVPFSPQWEGMDQFEGEVVHSRDYKNPKPFQGKKVLVIGMGNTGAELALDLAEKKVATYISVRSPIAIVPRDVNGRPVQVTAKQLAKIPFGIGDWLGTQIRRIVIGDLSKYGLPMSKIHPAEQLRETGKTPVIDLGTVAQIKAGNIKILADISCFYDKGVVLKNGEQHDFDAVILATGYRAKLEEFIKDTEGLLDRFRIPKQAVMKGKHEGLYFVGFDNYKLGGILGTIFTDSETVANAIAEKVPKQQNSLSELG
ncbi:MAG: NAD(P)/FAD-dependent oxidoreductase [Bacteroidota bacterium]